MARPCVYTIFNDADPDPKRQCNLLRLWVRSWHARGWCPRVLTSRNKPPHPANLCDVSVLNFALRPPRGFLVGKLVAIPYGELDWERSALVSFHRAEDAENCGRSL